MVELELRKNDVDLQELDHSMEKMDLEFEALLSASTTLESIYGGIDSGEVSLESASTALDVSFPAISSMVSFEGKEVSLEGIGEALKKIWESIKRTLRRAWDAFSAFFSKLFGGVGKLKSKVKELKPKFDSRYEYVQTKESKQLATMLSIDGKYDFGTLEEGIEHAKNIKSTLDVLPEHLESVYREVTDIVNKRSMFDGTLMDMLSKHTSVVKSGKMYQVLTGSPLPGNYYIVSIQFEDYFTAKLLSDMGLSDSTQLPEFGILQHTKTKNAKRLKEYNGNGEFTDKIYGSFCLKYLEGVEYLLTAVEEKKKFIESLDSVRDKATSSIQKLVEDSDRGKLSKLLTKAEISGLNMLLGSRVKTSVNRSFSYVYRYARNSVSFLEGLERAK